MRILHSKKLVFVSKPRCGSTSMRRALDSQMTLGDVKCDMAGQVDGLHPHMSAPAIYKYLQDSGVNPEDYRFFITIRNPVDMLRSYYKYFKPDSSYQYNYHPDYDSSSLSSFDMWLSSGAVGKEKFSYPHYPLFVSNENFSTLSLEAHIMDKSGRSTINNILMLENQKLIKEFLIAEFGSDCGYKQFNRSEVVAEENISIQNLKKIKRCFPLESVIYNL